MQYVVKIKHEDLRGGVSYFDSKDEANEFFKRLKEIIPSTSKIEGAVRRKE